MLGDSLLLIESTCSELLYIDKLLEEKVKFPLKMNVHAPGSSQNYFVQRIVGW